MANESAAKPISIDELLGPYQLGADGEFVVPVEVPLNFNPEAFVTNEASQVMVRLIQHHEERFMTIADPNLLIAIPFGQDEERFLIYRFPFELDWWKTSYLIATAEGFSVLCFPMTGGLISEKARKEKQVILSGGGEEYKSAVNKQVLPVAMINNILHVSMYGDPPEASLSYEAVAGGKAPIITFSLVFEDDDGDSEPENFEIGRGTEFGETSQPIRNLAELKQVEKYLATANNRVDLYLELIEETSRVAEASLLPVDKSSIKKKRGGPWRIVTAFRAILTSLGEL